MNKIKLYDLRKKDYPQKTRPFRTLQVFQCPICGWCTNRVWYIYIPEIDYPKGRRLYSKGCSNKDKNWHSELSGMIDRSTNNLYPPLPHILRKLRKEVAVYRKRITKKIKNDILGGPDLSLRLRKLFSEKEFGRLWP